MASRKKSRKVGRIGVPKSSQPRPIKPESGSKPKKHTGKPAGSRHSVAQARNENRANADKKDPRIGSKKPVPLIVEDKKEVPKPKYFSPAQELEALENDKQLNRLLDKLEQGKSLSAEQQAWVDQKMARHRTLCDLLGIQDEPQTEDAPSEDDVFDRFDNADLNKWKDQ
ncbi:GTPase-activating protein [Aestuariibacter halophilus]|uniref:Der GTPase-activating protein YihI n=1 Tax=Fluctibacter halophilus TaxID=226011 RepID=A0ABS8G8K7_9ALTE|nr:Der GTPase-activating protein YihI [Aestuariibacter halophilus]MCC2616912.1 GTPase-activating protein [Aestuariibacter halophilus]